MILPRLPVREMAEDVLRDTFRIVLERIELYTPEPGKSVYFWIRRIAINRALDVHRAHQRARRLEEAVEAEEHAQARVVEPDANLDQEDAHTRIQAALTRMNPRYAEALRLRMLDELERDECARRMGVTVGNFDVILHRASAAFRKAWLELPESP